MDKYLEKRILEDNILLHSEQAEFYNNAHVEIYNKPEQFRIWRKILHLRRLLGKKRLKVLDIGCGTGNLILKFDKLGDACYGIDISKEMLNKLKEKSSNVKVKVSNAEKLPFEDNFFDMVVGYSVLHHFPNPNKAIEEAIRVCKKGGIIYFDHEPLKRGLSHNLYSTFLFKINGAYVYLQMFLFGLEYKKLIGSSYVDYHVPTGIIPENLYTGNCKKIIIEKYFTNMIPFPNVFSKILNFLKFRGDMFSVTYIK